MTVTIQKDPTFEILKWKRFPQKINWERPNRFIISGMPESGKSSLGEVLAINYNKVIDIFCSRDNEGLGWCRHNKFKNNVLFIHGDTVRISSEWDEIKISQLKLQHFEEYKTIISTPAFYSNLREEWNAINKITGLLWRRTSWKEPWFVNVREGTSLLFSRLGMGDTQAQAKAQFIYAIREFRHCGCAIAVDIIRLGGLDVEVRSIADYTFIKAHGIWGLPRDLNWLYRYYDLFKDIMQMPSWVFIILTRHGGVGHGTFEYPYWHKEEKENIIQNLNIQIQYGDAINYGDKGREFSDFEHVNTIKVRINQKLSMNKLALGGTWKIEGEEIVLKKRGDPTIYKAIMEHNKDIESQGYCSICKRLNAKEQYQKA